MIPRRPGIRDLFFVGAIVVAASALAPRTSFAQNNTALAEKLFRDGERLFKQGKTHEACEKFAESQRLDPGLGTLMNMAICHEKEGRFATAWAEYTDVAQQASTHNQPAREKAARAHAKDLEPKVSYLSLSFSDRSVAEVKLDGQVLGSAAWSTAIPLDRGEHVLTFAAPGKKTLTKNVTITEPGTQTLEVPALQKEDVPPPVASAPASAPTPPPSDVTPPPAEEPRGGGARTVGFVVGGIGVAAIGVGAVFGIITLGKAKEGHCEGQVCDDQATADTRTSANTTAMVANITLGAGIVALGIGTVLVLTAPRTRSSAAPTKIRVGAAPTNGGGAFALGGAF